MKSDFRTLFRKSDFAKSDMLKKHDPFRTEGSSSNHSSLRRRSALHWIEEVDPEVSHVAEETDAPYLGMAVSRTRIAFFLAILIMLVGALGFRVFYVNGIEGAQYESQAERNRLRVRYVTPERGAIVDRNGRVLARNIPNFALVAIPADLPRSADDRAMLYHLLEPIFTAARVEVWRALIDAIPPASLEARRSLILADRLSYAEAIQFETLAVRPFGLYLDLRPTRVYPLSQELQSLGHILGYMGPVSEVEHTTLNTDEYTFADTLGKQGIEASHEHELRGRRGLDRFEVDARGAVLALVDREPPHGGATLELTIDADMQRALEEGLAKELKAKKLTQGAAIALDPTTGAIRALVSIPGYDNNAFARGISASAYAQLIENPSLPLFPRAIAGEFPSGSIVKPIIAAAALAEGIVTPQTSFLSVGGIWVGPWFFPDWKNGGHGPTNIYTAIAESVNTYFYIIGGGYNDREGLGVERIAAWARRFGLGEKLGIDLPGERGGFLPSKEWKERVKGEQWYIGDTYHLAIGQGDLLVTPLQAALWTSVFANGGTLYRPYLVEAYRAPDGSRTPVKPEIMRTDIVEKTVMRVVRDALHATVLRGSARSLQSLPVTSAGKTGTAEWSTIKKPHAWFTAFAPFENPEIVVTVLVQEGEEGSRSALPVAREFLNWYFRRSK